MVTQTFKVRKEIEFDAGHRVPNHKSKCRNPHGHRYKVQVEVQGPLDSTTDASSEGMVLDFADIKEALVAIHDKFDHGFIVYQSDLEMVNCFRHDWKVIVFPYIPTAENLAKWCFDELSSSLNSDFLGIRVTEVSVWETPTSVAVYGE